MWNRSAAQRLPSSPPSPPRISTITFLALVGIAGHEQLAEPGVELAELRFLRRDLAREVLAHLGVVLGREQLAHVGELGLGAPVRVVRLDDRLQLGVAAAGVARGRLVAGGIDLRQLRLELLQLGLELREAIEHGVQGTGGPRRPLRGQVE